MPRALGSHNAALLCRTLALKTLLGQIKSGKPKGCTSLGRVTSHASRSKGQRHVAVKESTSPCLNHLASNFFDHVFLGETPVEALLVYLFYLSFLA